MSRFFLAISTVPVVAASLLLAASAAIAQPGDPNLPFEYAVAFVCGKASPPTGAMTAPGNYFTAIQIHNPRARMHYAHKVALAIPGADGVQTPFVRPDRLEYDETIEVSCREIDRELKAAGIATGPLFTGFFVLDSPSELDVVAVYTTAGAGEVTSIHSERVPVRRLRRS